ncbi:MAG: methylated-DNA--[protein]-cysteine S-methyltransferase [Oscillospiraceae bacterium]|nr:methylated-DNA--[protein]-cysteine S-methyltransferase [Oscillospiraceae bacterium]
MTYTQTYSSPLGEVLLSADDMGLSGLWFVGQRYFARTLSPGAVPRETPVLTETKRWLDCYFSGKRPDFLPPLHLIGTDFQQAVWNLLLEIPYGQTVTYGALAQQLGKPAMSAQAVGAAVGRNPVSVIVPCHRVVGADGNLTGYAGGVERKLQLLQLEGADLTRLHVPKKS